MVTATVQADTTNQNQLRNWSELWKTSECPNTPNRLIVRWKRLDLRACAERRTTEKSETADKPQNRLNLFGGQTTKVTRGDGVSMENEQWPMGNEQRAHRHYRCQSPKCHSATPLHQYTTAAQPRIRILSWWWLTGRGRSTDGRRTTKRCATQLLVWRGEDVVHLWLGGRWRTANCIISTKTAVRHGAPV